MHACVLVLNKSLSFKPFCKVNQVIISDVKDYRWAFIQINANKNILYSVDYVFSHWWKTTWMFPLKSSCRLQQWSIQLDKYNTDSVI